MRGIRSFVAGFTEVFLSFVGGLGLFRVFEDPFLFVDGSFDHSFGFVNLDQLLVS